MVLMQRLGLRDDCDVDGNTPPDCRRHDAEVLEDLDAPLQLLGIRSFGANVQLHSYVIDAPASLLISSGSRGHFGAYLFDGLFASLQTEEQACRETVAHGSRQDAARIGSDAVPYWFRLIGCELWKLRIVEADSELEVSFAFNDDREFLRFGFV
jgi:hypothetical protein